MAPPPAAKPKANQPQRKKKKRACVDCHDAKSQTKCDRCLTSGKDCILHVSKQGQRPKKKNAEEAASAPPIPDTPKNQSLTAADAELKSLTNVVKQHADVLSESALQIGIADASLPAATLPLRQWIKLATGNVQVSRLSPEYIASCLKMAASLSKQISDAEEFESKMLNSLPLITADWAVDVKVKLGVPGTCHLSADQNIHIIVSAEISTELAN
jgi:hypothetical protein